MPFANNKAAVVAEWYRYRIVTCLVRSSSPVPLKTRRVGQRYFYRVILPVRLAIGPAENHDTTVHIRTDLPPCIAVGRRQSRPYACVGVLQTSTRPNVGKNVKDDSSDHITFFHLSIY
ncbi:hypothetical protein TNCV_3823861 [Trichonephila clavipes]|nr:hypothetical protein TNCV_3823861 [Trichonephila clavipes]